MPFFLAKNLGEKFGHRNIYPMNSFGERLKAVRGDRSQADFAKELGIPQVTLSNYETNKTEPKFKLLQTIVSIFCINIEWLMIGSGPMRTGELPQPAESAPQHPASTAETILCTRCAEMAAKVEKVEQQRDDLMQENRQWAAKTEQLLRENGDLRERCATLTERQSWLNEHKTGNTL